ncbi:hypothetical protein [uncultured Sulfitobacter sp.]|uniref:DUF7609 family protein n=1 Tax=uncultured Sulfitobacter sp. TaxID=191468 RepID=UPI002592CF0D|nr:hypothetical protein [uncultured Sulfitobacter sp.]
MQPEQELSTYADQIRALSYDESFSRTKRLPIPENPNVTEELQTLRLTVNATVSRIRRTTEGHDYTTESLTALNKEGTAILAIIVVTRIK